MDSAPESFDVALIGAGPIGLELAVNLKAAGVSYVHLEAQQIGHTISWFPRQARFFSSPERIAICGVPLVTVDQSKASREEYLAYLISIVQQFELPVRCYERVTRVSKAGEHGYLLQTQTAAGSRQYHANKVIFAMGDMHGPRVLEHEGMGQVPGADLPHVSHYFTEPHPYFGQELLIVGGKNSAIEAALRCYRAGARVTLCHRHHEISSSIKYWLRPEIEWLIATGAIHYFPGYVPVEITPTYTELVGVNERLVPELNSDRRQRIAANFVLLLIGYVMDCTLLAELGVTLSGPGKMPQTNPATMETNLPQVYVAGTAAAGTQLNFRLFIENCHAHVVRILRHLTGSDPRHLNSLGYARLHEHPLPAES